MRQKSKFWIWLVTLYVKFRMRRTFRDVLGRGLEETKDALALGPVVLVVNHVAWWDPLFLLLLERRLEADGYALMATHSLEELPLFGRLGALPLCQGNARKALSDLEAAASLLDRPRRFVAIFPTGAQRPSHFPLSFKGGASRLQKMSGARIIALALRYEFLESPQPTLIFSLGSAFLMPEGCTSRRATAVFEERVGQELAQIDQEMAALLVSPVEPPSGLQSLLYSAPEPLRRGRVPLLARFGGTSRISRSNSARPEAL